MNEQVEFYNVREKKRHYTGKYLNKSLRYEMQPLNPLIMQSYISYTAKEYSNKQIKQMLKNPTDNFEYLQDVSQYLSSNVAFYTNIVMYYASILTYDYILTPEQTEVKDTTLWNRYLTAAKICKDAKIQSNFTHMMYRTLLNGETFWYDLSDDQNTIFQEIPSEFCKRAMIDEDNLWRYYIDFRKIKSSELQELPEEIRIAYKNYTETDDKKKTKRLNGTNIEIPYYLYLVSKRGFSMSSTLNFEEHGYPFFSNMFIDLNNFDNDKEYFNNTIKLNNIKLIHFKVPIDKNTGEPTMDYDDVEKYVQASKSNLPDNVNAIANPFEPENITLEKSQQQSINIAENSKDNVTFSSGISETMWNATTTNGLKFSVEVDATKIKHLVVFFENLINYKIKDQKIKFTIDKEITWYNKSDIYKIRKEGMGMGDLYSGWISAGAYEPYDAIQLARMENKLDFASLFRPKQSSFQQSSNDTEKGAPEKDEKSDVTEENEQYR